MRLVWRAVRQVFAGIPGPVSRRMVAAAARALIVAAVVSANVVGAVIAVVLLRFVLPTPEGAVTEDPTGPAIRVQRLLRGAVHVALSNDLVVFARSISDPLRRLRDAFAAVEAGDLEAQVPVFDATEVGYAAAGFNRMVDGLRERERLRDLFGRQVGTDVARRALEQGVTLGGEEREAAVLFVDIIGSTGFAADRPATEVVDVLNAFFATVVEVTQQHGGLVNKFAGDAALCVFGAPLAREDAAGSALAAGREMCRRLKASQLDAGIGVSAGTVVAGNVGTRERYEYTVIGDPVNEAARLTELAKERDGRLLASEAALDRASHEESARWELGEEVDLRERTRPTRLAQASERKRG